MSRFAGSDSVFSRRWKFLMFSARTKSKFLLDMTELSSMTTASPARRLRDAPGKFSTASG